MSNSTRLERDASSDVRITRAVVPILVAAGAVTLALVVTQGDLSAHAPATDAAARPAHAPATAYSEDHQRVEEAPGEPEPLPPTF